MTQSPEINQLAAALSLAQGAIEGAAKSSSNPFFGSKYADLASVKAAIGDAFKANGLSVVQFPTTAYAGDPVAYEWQSRGDKPRFGVRVFCTVSVTTRLLHSSGQWLEDSVSAMLPNGDPQAVGSAITYLRRYALQAVAGVAAEDDDAEATTRQDSRTAPAAAAAVIPAAVANAPAAAAAVVSGPVAAPPLGYAAWLDVLTAAAGRGTLELNHTWKRSPETLRVYLVTMAPATWPNLQAQARRIA